MCHRTHTHTHIRVLYIFRNIYIDVLARQWERDETERTRWRGTQGHRARDAPETRVNARGRRARERDGSMSAHRGNGANRNTYDVMYRRDDRLRRRRVAARSP